MDESIRHADHADRLDEWVRGTLLFQHWEAVKQDILLHKWYESERAGCDIGWERACVDWLVRHGNRSCPGVIRR